MISLKSRDEGGPPIAGQALVYPVTDLSSLSTGSYTEFAEGHHLTRAEMEWFRNHYLPDEAAGRNPLASPLLAADLGGLPPARLSPLSATCCGMRAKRTGNVCGKRV